MSDKIFRDFVHLLVKARSLIEQFGNVSFHETLEKESDELAQLAFYVSEGWNAYLMKFGRSSFAELPEVMALVEKRLRLLEVIKSLWNGSPLQADEFLGKIEEMMSVEEACGVAWAFFFWSADEEFSKKMEMATCLHARLQKFLDEPLS
jgi:hypothetical protein